MNEYSIPAIERLLRDYPFISEDIDRLQKELEDWQNKKNTMYGIKTAAPTGMPPSGQLSDPTYQTATEIIDKYQKEIDRLFDRIKTLFDNQMTVKTLLMRLNRNERYVIEARYFHRPPVTWRRIARELCYDKRSCYRFKVEALKKMASQF
jgi:RinA family phage transcriptional activator